MAMAMTEASHSHVLVPIQNSDSRNHIIDIYVDRSIDGSNEVADDMENSCIVCMEPLEWVSYGKCGHRQVCARCTIRMRSSGCHNHKCYICGTYCPTVYFTNVKAKRARAGYNKEMQPIVHQPERQTSKIILIQRQQNPATSLRSSDTQQARPAAVHRQSECSCLFNYSVEISAIIAAICCIAVGVPLAIKAHWGGKLTIFLFLGSATIVCVVAFLMAMVTLKDDDEEEGTSECVSTTLGCCAFGVLFFGFGPALIYHKW